MDERTDGISRRQLSILLFVSALSPLIRQAPGMAVQSAGSAVWLSALLALVPLPLAGLLLGRLTRKRVPGEGLGGVLLRVFGRFGGTAAVLLYTAWTVFYAGFVLRAGADRFVTAVYPGSRPWLFMAVMAALCVPACLGRLKTLGRCAEIALPLLALVFLFAFLFCLPGLDAANHAPISSVPLRPDGAGAARRAVQPRVSRARSARGAFMRHGRRHVRREAHRRDVLSVFRYDPVHPHLPPARARGGARRGAVGHDRLSPARRAFAGGNRRAHAVFPEARGAARRRCSHVSHARARGRGAVRADGVFPAGAFAHACPHRQRFRRWGTRACIRSRAGAEEYLTRSLASPV